MPSEQPMSGFLRDQPVAKCPGCGHVTTVRFLDPITFDPVMPWCSPCERRYWPPFEADSPST